MEKAKQLLGHPNFNKLSLQQIQQVFAVILASGVTKDQITSILREIETEKERYALQKANVSHLELLPRNVFKHMVEVGQIKGKDLVHLCNSSPILRNYCLADLKDINGEVIEHQEIYSLALKRVLGKGYKPKISPLVDFVNLLGSYIVIRQVVRQDGIREEKQELDNPRYIKQISPGRTTVSILDYQGTALVKSYSDLSYMPYKLSMPNVAKITANLHGTLMLDNNQDLWYVGKLNRIDVNGKYGDGTESWDYTYNRPIKLPKTFSIYLNVKEGSIEKEIKIKKIASDNMMFYFLTREGNLLRTPSTILKLGEEIETGNFKKIYVNLIEEEIKWFEPNPRILGDYTAIKYDGTIIVYDFGKDFGGTYKLPSNVNPVKAKVIGDSLLVLDTENKLWEIDVKKIATVIEAGVIDFDVYMLKSVGEMPRKILYYVKTDMIVYRKFNFNIPWNEVFYNEKPIKKIKATYYGTSFGHSVLMFSPAFE